MAKSFFNAPGFDVIAKAIAAVRAAVPALHRDKDGAHTRALRMHTAQDPGLSARTRGDTVTDIYIAFDTRKIHNANRKVIRHVF